MKKICLIGDCGKPIHARGLCSSCYGAATELTKKGKISWETLEELGFALESNPPKSAFSKAIKDIL